MSKLEDVIRARFRRESDKFVRRFCFRLIRHARRALDRKTRGQLIPKPDMERLERRDRHRFDESTHYCRRCSISARRARAGGISCRMQRVRLGNRARKTRRGYR